MILGPAENKLNSRAKVEWAENIENIKGSIDVLVQLIMNLSTAQSKTNDQHMLNNNNNKNIAIKIIKIIMW
jgi:hypothetical protein